MSNSQQYANPCFMALIARLFAVLCSPIPAPYMCSAEVWSCIKGCGHKGVKRVHMCLPMHILSNREELNIERGNIIHKEIVY